MENKKKGFLLGRRASEGYFLSTATRALIIGVAVIVVCIVCSLALYMSKQGKAAINTGTNQYNKMLEDYQDRESWQKKVLVNIAKAGFFSSDRTIREYNRDIWKL